jgi:uncharacterized Fe-S center protein
LKAISVLDVVPVGVCIAFCPSNAIKIPLLIAHPKIQEGIIESAVAVLSLIKREKVFFYNFIIDVNPNCDCFPFTENTIVPDVGIMASRDPLAVDKASYDIICEYPPLSTFNAKEICSAIDKFKSATKVDISSQFEYAEQIGAGTTNYHLVRIPFL